VSVSTHLQPPTRKFKGKDSYAMLHSGLQTKFVVRTPKSQPSPSLIANSEVDRDTGERLSAQSEERLINESVSSFTKDPDVEWVR